MKPSRGIYLKAFFVVAALLAGSNAASAASKVETSASALRSQSALEKRVGQKPSFSRGDIDAGKQKNPLPQTTSTLSLRGGVANTLTNSLLGAVAFALVEQATKEGLRVADINFPSSLGGCIALFIFLILAEVVSPDLAGSIFDALSPGAAFLAKWLPPFFVPGLVMLPLAPSVGGTVEIAKVIGIVIVGFFYTMFTSSFAVVAIRRAQGTLTTTGGGQRGSKASSSTVSQNKAKAFDDASCNLFYKGTIITGIISILATRTGNAYKTPLETIFLVFLTMSTYMWGANLPAAFVKVVHPLVTSSVLVLLGIRGLATVTGDRDFVEVLSAYRANTLDPLKMGAGDLLMYLLGPSVVSFAISVYSRRVLLQKNLLVVLTSMLVASVGGLFGTAALVRAAAVGTGSSAAMVRLSILARNITTALAIALTKMIGGDISIAASVVCLTGILGGTYGKALLNAWDVRDPICRGLGIGCSAQGLGVAAMLDEPEAFPFAAIAMVLTAISATTLASFPAVQKVLIRIATDGVPAVAPTPVP